MASLKGYLANRVCVLTDFWRFFEEFLSRKTRRIDKAEHS